MTTILAAIAFGAALVQGTTESVNDLSVTTFDLPEGRVTVYLPNDLMAGDTISGTVVSTPAGTGDLLRSNTDVLEGLVVKVQGVVPQAKGPSCKWEIPLGIGAIALSLVSRSGTPRGEASVTTLPPGVANAAPKFECDPILNPAGPMTLYGPFDGDSATTAVDCGSNPASVLAETPRSAHILAAGATPGPVELKIRENGASASIPANLIRLSLSAPKTTLMEGEQVKVTVRFEGLQGLSPKHYPIPCEFVNEARTVVRMEQEVDGRFAMALAPAQVRNGVGTVQIGLIGIQPGKFLIRGLAFNTSIHSIKKLLSPSAFNTWVDAMIAKYEEEIKALEASGASCGGTKSKIARKRKVLSVLKGNRNANSNTLGDCKQAVDVALAEDSFFTLAKELLTTAADLLGYTDVPMPAFGTIMKGLQAIAAGAKLVKTVAALQKLQGLVDAYDTLTDLAEKAEKLKEIKEMVDTVKEALDSETDD